MQVRHPLTQQQSQHSVPTLSDRIGQAREAWLAKSPSRDTRSNYERDLRQFLAFAGISYERPDQLAAIRPHQVAAWRDKLR